MCHFTLSLFASRSPPSKPPAPCSGPANRCRCSVFFPMWPSLLLSPSHIFRFSISCAQRCPPGLTVESHCDGRSPQPDVEVMLGVYGRGVA
ncbi:hypothetical protein NL676_028972 [Syzygium grande]|nr:hypothetical protein NL676_028972 [Syzygium grande]